MFTCFFTIHYSLPNLRILDARVLTTIIPLELPRFSCPSCFLCIHFQKAQPPWLSQLFPFSVFTAEQLDVAGKKFSSGFILNVALKS